MASSQLNPRAESVWRVLWQTIRDSPWWGKLSIGGFVVAFVGVTILGVVGMTDSEHPNVRWHVASMVFANLGLLLLSLTAFLHSSSQQARRKPEMWRVVCLPFHAKSNRIHAVMLALPVLALKAGILLTVGTTLLVPSMFAPPNTKLIIAGVFYGSFVLVAGWTVRDTTRFLYRYARDQTDAAAQAQTEASIAQLSALQAQLHPHFLFNALNTVASLIRTDPLSAEDTVENLAQVLRRTLDRSHRSLSTVQEEIEYLEAYLSIERARFGNRLRIEWDIDPATLEDPIPPMTLQPLVENALKHGIGSRLAGGTVTISTTRREGQLGLEVADDGVGFGPNHTERTGLSNLRERLRTMYGQDAGMQIHTNGVGARISLTIPIPESRDGLNSIAGHATGTSRV